MTKHYVFFTRNVLPQPRADLVQVANCANAAANLGYSTVLTSLQQGQSAYNLANWVFPFRPHAPSPELAQFYSLQEKLKVVTLAIPELFDRFKTRWTAPSTIICKYYLPLYIRPVAQLVHSRDWNFVKAAIQNGIPAIYEHHHHEQKQFEPEVVHHPLFQIAVTVAEPVRDSMIASGMPPDKVIKLHNGFNQLFLTRHQQQAAAWRQKLITSQYQHLVVYSGALHPFKGVDLLLEVAKKLPQVRFVFAGGSKEQVTAYQDLASEKQVENALFLGYLLHEQLVSLLQAADILAHPHGSGKAATFTSPLKFFEYMAAGTPIAATEIPPLLEFKPSGAVAGWCEPDNPIKFTECIERILETHPRKLEGYANSINFVHQFSWENRIRQIMDYVKPDLRPLN
jgi:glycosyltransferase involved in cell wall biosynthesis